MQEFTAILLGSTGQPWHSFLLNQSKICTTLSSTLGEVRQLGFDPKPPFTQFFIGIFVSKSKEREQLNRTAPQFLHNKISMAYVIRLPILLGLVSVVMILVNRQLTEYPRYIRGVWAVFTVAVVLMPSVGSTWQR
jgi:hypothetical protein